MTGPDDPPRCGYGALVLVVLPIAVAIVGLVILLFVYDGVTIDH